MSQDDLPNRIGDEDTRGDHYGKHELQLEEHDVLNW